MPREKGLIRGSETASELQRLLRIWFETTSRIRFVAARDAEGSYTMVYAPVGRPFSVRMDKIGGPKVRAWWFNPRDGKSTAVGEFDAGGTREFCSPDRGEEIDWVLVLDQASKDYPPPGQGLFDRG